MILQNAIQFVQNVFAGNWSGAWQNMVNIFGVASIAMAPMNMLANGVQRAMAGTYTTRQGDAWDAIAQRVYGSVKYTGWLMENNHPHLDTFRFQAGVVLQTPDPDNMPIWRTGA